MVLHVCTELLPVDRKALCSEKKLKSEKKLEIYIHLFFKKQKLQFMFSFILVMPTLICLPPKSPIKCKGWF